MKWMIIAKEVGADGTPHLQGAFILNKQTAFSTVKKLPGLHRAHLEIMLGTPQDSLVYCSKQDAAPYVFGTLPTPGKRTDLSYVTERVLDGESLHSLAQDVQGAQCIVKFFKGLTVLRSCIRPDRTEAPKIFWLHGKTGTGKTRSSFELANRLGDVWISAGGLQWFDGYDGQRSAIFDDFRAKHVYFPFLLQLLDRYPLSVPIKGGFVKWTPELIFITTPGDPHETFATRKTYIPEDINQLIRRIEQGGGGIYHFEGDKNKFDRDTKNLQPEVQRDPGNPTDGSLENQPLSPVLVEEARRMGDEEQDDPVANRSEELSLEDWIARDQGFDNDEIDEDDYNNWF